jgi:SAM-dependent methyltransferase
MNRSLLSILCCPECRADLSLVESNGVHGAVSQGTLKCVICARTYPISNFIPRFVSDANYASNFGFQWNRFRRTQLDSATGASISTERFFTSSDWTSHELQRQSVLDVGCGAGRFAEVPLNLGSRVVAIDYSSAVDACMANLGPSPRLDVVQADIYKLPFKDASFSYVYCFGVLQHTPDVKRAFMSLPRLLGPGGKLAVDVYPRLRLNAIWPKYWLRPITTRMDQQRLFRVIERSVPWLLPISDALSRVPRFGRKLRWAVPVANHRLDYPQLSPEQIREWAVLNTYDMFGPAYDRPQTAETLEAWFHEAGMTATKVFRHGHLCGHAVR